MNSLFNIAGYCVQSVKKNVKHVVIAYNPSHSGTESQKAGQNVKNELFNSIL